MTIQVGVPVRFVLVFESESESHEEAIGKAREHLAALATGRESLALGDTGVRLIPQPVGELHAMEKVEGHFPAVYWTDAGDRPPSGPQGFPGRSGQG